MFYFSKKVRLFSQNDVLFLFYFLINPAGTTAQQSCDGLKLINCTNTSVMLKNGKTHCLVISPNQIKLPSICCLAQFFILDKTKILESVEFTLLLHMKNRDPEVIWDYIKNFIAYRFFRWNQEKRGRSTSVLSVRWNYSQRRL